MVALGPGADHRDGRALRRNGNIRFGVLAQARSTPANLAGKFADEPLNRILIGHVRIGTSFGGSNRPRRSAL